VHAKPGASTTYLCLLLLLVLLLNDHTLSSVCCLM
jgi:hypothetical protein